jgi:hypothetical protein
MQELRQDLNVLLEKEELRWKQRAKEEWLRYGDRNTKYYHACANARRKWNFVEAIKDDDGLLRDNPNAVGEAFVDFFTKLFSAGHRGDLEPCLQPIDTRVSSNMNEELTKSFSAEEVRAALFQMAPLKAPGPDGLNACFFQKNWSIVGEEVCTMILHSLNSGVMPNSLNKTYVALIPKIKSPTSVLEFRPISLCNVLYKLIAKVLANRLKKILPTIIDHTQSAFIPGRLITDNILAAYETLHTMNSGMRGKKGYMAIKLDMSKAYDRVE